MSGIIRATESLRDLIVNSTPSDSVCTRRSILLFCHDAGLRHEIMAFGVGQHWCGRIVGKLVRTWRHFMFAIEHVVERDYSACVCAAMRPIEVAMLASTPRFASL